MKLLLFQLRAEWFSYWLDRPMMRVTEAPDWRKAYRAGNARMTPRQILWTRTKILLLDAASLLLAPLVILFMIVMVVPSFLATWAADEAEALREGIEPTKPKYDKIN